MTSFNVTKNVNESFTFPIPGYVVNTTPVARITEEFAVSMGAPTFAMSQTVAGIITSPVITVAEPTSTTTGASSGTYNALAGDCHIFQGSSTTIPDSFSSSDTRLGIGTLYVATDTTIAYKYKTWIPFTVTIGSITIKSAILTLIASESSSGITTKIKVGCDNRTDIVPPSTNFPTTQDELNMRTLTSNVVVDDNVSAWVAGTTYTYNITAAVQEILSKSGWASGRVIAVLITDNGSDANGACRYIASFDNVTYTEPRLTITW